MSARSRHPWHPVFVHFPIACWVIALVVEVLYWALPYLVLPGGLAPGGFAVLMLWIGNVTGVIAVLTGVLDFGRLPDNPKVISTVYKHMAWMASGWGFMLAAALLRSINEGWKAPPESTVLIAELLAVFCLVAGGLQASRLVYDLHLGKACRGPE